MHRFWEDPRTIIDQPDGCTGEGTPSVNANLRFRGFVFLARLPVEADRELGVGNHSLHFIGIWTFLAFRIYFGGDVVIGCSRDDGVVSVVG